MRKNIHFHIHHFPFVFYFFSLVKALLSGKYSTKGTTDEEITDGIDIAEWTVKIASKDSDYDQAINFSVWDFAGQSVYYNTHQVL